MSIAEQYQPVAHRHDDCPICHSPALIQDIPVPRNSFDRLRVTINNMNARLRSEFGTKIEVREDK
jgi:hypothetical protein